MTHASASRNAFSRRLGAYMLGIAIGLVFLGFFHTQRSRMRQQQAQQQARDESGSSESPNPPAERTPPLDDHSGGAPDD